MAQCLTHPRAVPPAPRARERRHRSRIRVSSQPPARITEGVMGSITGSELLAKSLKAQGMDTLFYLMGGPMLETESACIKLGVRAIDSRQEQGAGMMAHAYSRLTPRPGGRMAPSG